MLRASGAGVGISIKRLLIGKVKIQSNKYLFKRDYNQNTKLEKPSLCLCLDLFRSCQVWLIYVEQENSY